MSKFVAWLDALAESPVFAFGSILLLQLKSIWGIWVRKDLALGDTAYYFPLAQAWHNMHAVDLVWSPIYTAYYGMFLNMSQDAYAVTLTHRIPIVLALAIAVLAVMRRLLPPVLAWLAAAHWVILPINFDSIYEVHLLYVLLALVLYLAVLDLPEPLNRGVGTAMLLVLAALMRNEVFLPFLLFGCIALGFDLWRCFKTRSETVGRVALAYLAPLAAAVALCAFVYGHSLRKGPDISAGLAQKHTLNVCQIYAFGYQQRHPEWTKWPWTECPELIQKTFGKPEVTMLEATRLNPKAMLEHYLWNVRLIPSGLQVLLFSVTSSHINPDYAPVPVWPRPAILASCLLGALLIWGGIIFLREPVHRKFLRARLWGWLVMVCVASVVVIVMIAERPRPSYMFTLELLITAWAGFSAQMIGSRWPWTAKLRPLFAPFVVACILLLPCYYYYRTDLAVRPGLEIYRRLAPFQQLIRANAGVVIPIAAPELCFYLSEPGRTCRGIPYSSIRARLGSGWDKTLTAENVQFFLASEELLRDSAGTAFLNEAPSRGWKIVEREDAPENRWLLLEKMEAGRVAASEH
jgi:hypothetical protein